jgi:hypothetical protein
MSQDKYQNAFIFIRSSPLPLVVILYSHYSYHIAYSTSRVSIKFQTLAVKDCKMYVIGSHFVGKEWKALHFGSQNQGVNDSQTLITEALLPGYF